MGIKEEIIKEETTVFTCSDGKTYMVHRIEERVNPQKIIKLYKIAYGESVANKVKNNTPIWTKAFDCSKIFSITDEGIMGQNEEYITEFGYLNDGFLVPQSKHINKREISEYKSYLTSSVYFPEIHRIKLPVGSPEYLNQGLDYTKFAGKGQLVHTRQVFVANNGDVYQVLQVWTYGSLKEGVDKMVILSWRN